MTAYISRLTQSKAGKVVASIVAAAAVVLAVYVTKLYLHGDTPDDAFYKEYIDTETMKPFRHKNEMGESLPITSPFTGKATGMPAEACYWTASGSAKTDPTWVLLNEELNKPGPTYCPDCGRLVVGHNPAPGPGVRPPPTAAEYAEIQASRYGR